MLIRQALRWAEGALRRSGVTSPRLDAEALLAEILTGDRAFLFSHPEEPLSGQAEEILRIWIGRRSRGLPVAYILGKKEFWSLEFLVTPAVLIPRPETELLVEASLKKAAGGKKPLVIGEMGCGSGAVIVSLARELGPGRFYATDTCSYALGVARRNAIRHGVENKISFLRSDLLAALISQGLKGELDQVLSNPPYIPRGQMPSLPGEIRLYEPKQALDGGEDGFLVYRRLIPQALTFLKPGGWLLLEMGEGQAGAISALLWQAGGFGEIEVWRDYQGMDRVICAQRGRSRVG